MTDRITLKPLWRGLALILLPSVVLGGLETYQIARTVPQLRQSQAWVDHTIEVMTTAQALGRALRDAERGQRGFLITGDEAYLDPYRSGVQQVPNLLSTLKRLTADNPEQQRRWPDLENQIEIKLIELKRTIDARQKEGFDAARQIVESNVGIDSMHSIATLLDAAVATEKTLLKQREALGDDAEHAAAVVSVISIAVASVTIALGAFLVTTSVRRFLRSEEALRESEGRFRLMVSGIKDYALSMLDPEGRIITWNEGCAYGGLSIGGDFRSSLLVLFPQ